MELAEVREGRTCVGCTILNMHARNSAPATSLRHFCCQVAYDQLHGPFMRVGMGKSETKGEDKWLESCGSKWVLVGARV